MVYETTAPSDASPSPTTSSTEPSSEKPTAPRTKPPPPRRLNTTRRNLYFHHENVVESLAGKDEQYRQASKRAHASNHAAKSAEHHLSTIRATETSISEQLQVLQTRKLRNLLFKKRAHSTRADLQTRLSAATDAARIAKEGCSRAKAIAEKDIEACRALRHDAKVWRQSERTRRAILEKAYGGQDAGSPVENLIETERDRLAEATDRAKDKLNTQKQALSLLKQAGSDLIKARQDLHDAQVTNTVDLFSSSAIGFVAGISSQYHVKMAGNLARNAGKKIQRAVELNDELPIRKLATVNDSAALAFTDIFLDGVVTDLLIRITIQKSVRSIDTVLTTLKESIEVQIRTVEELEGHVSRYSSDLKRTSDDLVRVRAELIHSLHAQ